MVYSVSQILNWWRSIHQSIISNHWYFAGSQGGWSPSWDWPTAGYTPWTSRQFITGLTCWDKKPNHAYIHTYWQFRVTHMHVFGKWEETRVLRVPVANPRRDGEDMQTRHIIITILLLLFTISPVQIQELHHTFILTCVSLTVHIFCDLCVKEFMNFPFIMQPWVV